jgi:DNA replication and repair protein RecF
MSFDTLKLTGIGILLNTSTSGPHRDRFLFRLGGRDFLKEASTGQLRLMSLVLRAAQSRLYARMAGKAPVLLLDDVLLELDAPKRKKFMLELPKYQQAFFTFLPDENISLYQGGQLDQVSGRRRQVYGDGRVTVWNMR